MTLGICSVILGTSTGITAEDSREIETDPIKACTQCRPMQATVLARI